MKKDAIRLQITWLQINTDVPSGKKISRSKHPVKIGISLWTIAHHNVVA